MKSLLADRVTLNMAAYRIDRSNIVQATGVDVLISAPQKGWSSTPALPGETGPADDDPDRRDARS